MSSVTLTINQRRNLINDRTIRGIKTILINATPNWPNGALFPYPSIPLDIIIEITVKTGSVSAKYYAPLPNVGYRGVFSSDEIVVDVYYSPNQALPAPYPMYIINGGIIAGASPPAISSVVAKWDAPWGVLRYWPSATTWGDVPPFSTEFRIHSNMIGELLFSEFDVLGNLQWIKRYDWQECDQWQALNPLAVYWRGIIQYTTYSIPYPNERGSSMLEFR